MNLEDFLSEYEIVKIDSSMNLRSIFRYQYCEFDEIRLRGNLYKLPYTKIIQKYLTEHNILQSNGEPISLVHIRNEMAAVGREVANGFKPRKSKLVQHSPQIDLHDVTKDPTPLLEIDFLAEKNTIELEFAKKLSGDKALLEWNAINQEALIHFNLLANHQNLTIHDLELKHFKSDIEFNFFKVWMRKAKLLKQLNT